MKQLSSAQVRQMWLDFWASKGHAVEPSVSLVPVNDPTLLWINSGVATLRNISTGPLFQKIHGLPMRRKRFGRMTLKMSEKQHVIIPCLKCWGIFLLVIISVMKRLNGLLSS